MSWLTWETQPPSALITYAVPLHQLVEVYRHTFLGGWLDAWHALDNGNWLWYSLAMLVLVGIVSRYLSGGNFENSPPDSNKARHALVGGFLFLLPSPWESLSGWINILETCGGCIFTCQSAQLSLSWEFCSC